MKPSIGRVVHYFQGDWEVCGEMFPEFKSLGCGERQKFVDPVRAALRGRNGTRVHPAMVTQVWSDTCVNLTVFFADGTVEMRSSACALADSSNPSAPENSGWRWPERVAGEGGAK